MPRSSRVLGALAAIVVVTLSDPAGAAPGASLAPARGGATIELVRQTPVVAPEGTFVVHVRLTGVPADGSIQMIVHQRVRSRSELALSMEGEELRSAAYDPVTALASLPEQADGTRRLALSLDPADGGFSLPTEGVYPVELIAQDAAVQPVATLMTHLIVAPGDEDEAPPLGVAVVAEVGAPPALRRDGSVTVARSDVEDMAALVAGLAGAPEVTANIAARPETVDALLASTVAGDAELVDALRAAAVGRTVLSLPYTEVSPDALAPAGLLGEVGAQMERGHAVLADGLGADPVATAWLSPPDLGADGLAALAFIGVRRVVVADDQVAPLEPGLISYSLAQPFLLTAPEGTPEDDGAPPVQGIATDPTVLERLATAGSPGLVASRVLAELALLRLEQPSVARSTVLPLPSGTPAGVVQLLLEGLGADRPFASLTLDAAFDHSAALVDGAEDAVERPLLPTTPEEISDAEGRALREARDQLTTYAGLVGVDSPDTDGLERHLLVASASGLTETRRRAHVEAVTSAVGAVTSQVTTPATFTLTLAARDGTIPLTIRNDSGRTLTVSVRLRSQKLEFPEGSTIPVVLTEASTRLDIPVRALTSGAFPLQVDVMTPDGERSLAMTRYTIRSTAVSGAGLLLSIGAGVFLVVWWARHWHRTRRSQRLVAADAHPAAK